MIAAQRANQFAATRLQPRRAHGTIIQRLLRSLRAALCRAQFRRRGRLKHWASHGAKVIAQPARSGKRDKAPPKEYDVATGWPGRTSYKQGLVACRNLFIAECLAHFVHSPLPVRPRRTAPRESPLRRLRLDHALLLPSALRRILPCRSCMRARQRPAFRGPRTAA